MSNTYDLINSSPNTLSNKMNQELGEYIKKSGFNFNSNCLDVVLANGKKGLSSYFKKVGDFNWRKASNPTYTPEKRVPFRDYSKKCPEGWEDIGAEQCTSNTYNGRCNSGKEECVNEWVDSGRKKTEYYNETENQPINDGPSYFGNYNSNDKANWARDCGVQWSGETRLANCPDGWTDLGGGACRAPYWYWGPCAQVSGFNGYDDNAKRDWANYCVNGMWTNKVTTNINTDCPDGWTKQSNGACCGPDSYRGPCNSCKNVGSRQVTVQRSRELPIYEWRTRCTRQPGSSFRGYSDWQKAEWGRQCGADWPMNIRIEEGYWSCNYGSSIEDDMRDSNVFMIGEANTLNEAVMMVLGNMYVAKPRFFAYVDKKVYLARNGEGNVFVDKGRYESNCVQNNKSVEVYEIGEELFGKLNECKEVNDLVNNFNDGLEGFENYENGISYGYMVAIIFLLIFLIFCYYFR